MSRMKKTILLAATAAILFQTAVPCFGAGGWRQEGNGQWYYYGEDDRRQTGWVEDQGKWYYMDASGQMVKNTVKVIDNVSYEFDENGAWREGGSQVGEEKSARPGTWTSDTVFENSWSGLSLVFPAGYTNEAYDGSYEGWIQDFSVCSPEGDLMFQSVYKDMGTAAGESEVKQLMEELKARLTSLEGYGFSSSGQVEIRGQSYQKISFSMADSLIRDIYLRPVGNHVMVLEALYCKGRESAAGQILKED